MQRAATEAAAQTAAALHEKLALHQAREDKVRASLNCECVGFYRFFLRSHAQWRRLARRVSLASFRAPRTRVGRPRLCSYPP